MLYINVAKVAFLFYLLIYVRENKSLTHVFYIYTFSLILIEQKC